MKDWLITYGKVSFDINPLTKKHNKQSDWKSHVIAFINDDMYNYYQWFLKRRYNLDLIKPIRGTHYTIVNDRTSDIINWEETKKKWDNKIIEIYYNIDIRSNSKHWWLKAYSKEGMQIRKELGLNKPFYAPHITIGLVNEKNQLVSDYSLRCEQRYNKLDKIEIPKEYIK